MRGIDVPIHERHDFVLEGGAPEGNPFLVELSAAFEHESGEAIRSIAGWYGGDGRWTVRFSPTREGT